MLEARQAFASLLSLDRDVQPGDRFHVRYEQTFTAEGAPIGIGRVMWAELRTKAKGTIAIYRFRSRDKTERFWLANGQAATPPSMRLPLETISVSSGFGLRADPFDQPPPVAVSGKPAPMGGPKRSASLPPGLPTGGVSGNSPAATANMATPLGASLGLVPYGNWQAAPRAVAARSMFMHEGIDLVAPAGTAVYAAADGLVVGAAPNGRYGNWIRIEHGSRLATVYGHLSAFAPGIEPGEAVVRGELIGFVGSTGRSTGAHLHFELSERRQTGQSDQSSGAQGRAAARARSRALPQAGRAFVRGARPRGQRRRFSRALTHRSRRLPRAPAPAGSGRPVRTR